MNKNELTLAQRLDKYIYENDLPNEDLVQIIEVVGDYLNLKTISNYAKDGGLSYNGVKFTRKIVSLFGVKFVVDNK